MTVGDDSRQANWSNSVKEENSRWIPYWVRALSGLGLGTAYIHKRCGAFTPILDKWWAYRRILWKSEGVDLDDSDVLACRSMCLSPCSGLKLDRYQRGTTRRKHPEDIAFL